MCAHELGHIILHPDVNTSFLMRRTLFSVDKIEQQANRFAIGLLMADMQTDGNDVITARECMAMYGIPHEFEPLIVR